MFATWTAEPAGRVVGELRPMMARGLHGQDSSQARLQAGLTDPRAGAEDRVLRAAPHAGGRVRHLRPLELRRRPGVCNATWTLHRRDGDTASQVHGGLVNKAAMTVLAAG
jgi:hypothetical protein